MRYIFIFLLIFITGSCQTVPPFDLTRPPTFPDLEGNSWVYLNSSRNLSIRVVANEHITVSDNNTPYISFTEPGKLYVYRWGGSDWIQVGGEIALETGSIHDSLITHNNILYITYKNNVKKLKNNRWEDVPLPTGGNLNSISLHSHGNKLYLTYISDADKKLHVKYLEGNSWKNYGLTSNDKFSGSMNNGIQMAFYNNVPYIALKNFGYRNARILVLNGDSWEYTSPLTTPGGHSVNSDYFFYIDSLGTMYLSFLVGDVAAVGSFKIFKKSISADKWQAATPFPNQVYGYQTVLHQDQLYIASSPSIPGPYGIGTVAGPAIFNKFNSALGLDNIGKNTVSDKSSTGSNVKLAIKDNRIFAMYLDFEKGSVVVKTALLK